MQQQIGKATFQAEEAKAWLSNYNLQIDILANAKVDAVIIVQKDCWIGTLFVLPLLFPVRW
jgi:hypothetical protein